MLNYQRAMVFIVVSCFFRIISPLVTDGYWFRWVFFRRCQVAGFATLVPKKLDIFIGRGVIEAGDVDGRLWRVFFVSFWWLICGNTWIIWIYLDNGNAVSIHNGSTCTRI